MFIGTHLCHGSLTACCPHPLTRSPTGVLTIAGRSAFRGRRARKPLCSCEFLSPHLDRGKTAFGFSSSSFFSFATSLAGLSRCEGHDGFCIPRTVRQRVHAVSGHRWTRTVCHFDSHAADYVLRDVSYRLRKWPWLRWSFSPVLFMLSMALPAALSEAFERGKATGKQLNGSLARGFCRSSASLRRSAERSMKRTAMPTNPRQGCGPEFSWICSVVGTVCSWA